MKAPVISNNPNKTQKNPEEPRKTNNNNKNKNNNKNNNNNKIINMINNKDINKNIQIRHCRDGFAPAALREPFSVCTVLCISLKID